jgi:hypothetical protein
MSSLLPALLGSISTLLFGACLYRLRTWWRHRTLDWRGGYDAAETRFQAQIDGAFTQENFDDDDDDDDFDLTPEDLALQRDLETAAAVKTAVVVVVDNNKKRGGVVGEEEFKTQSGAGATAVSVSAAVTELRGRMGEKGDGSDYRDDEDDADDEATPLSNP